MEYLVSVQDLACVRQERTVLAGIRFQVKPGEIVGVIGPNGAGKSTLLRCLAGLLPASGRIELDGQAIAALPPRRRARLVAMMHQDSPATLPFSAREVVMMGRFAHGGRFGSETAHDRQAVEAALDFTDTTKLGETVIAAMSGGERQRVMLARALAQETRILLLDEPTASLDIAYQEQIFGLIVRLARQGRAIVAAIHDLRLAARFCSRLVLLSKGEVVADGAPDSVLTSANLAAAYGVRMRVWRNHISGLLDLHPVDDGGTEGMPHVHVIGGGGSASGVLRQLGDEGYRLSAGVLTPGDSDLLCAGIYGIPVVTGQPFTVIGDSAFRDNCDLAARADLTILCNCAWGLQNLRNLEAAACARQLLILEDDDPALRDFSGGKALAEYRHIRAHATVLGSAQLAAWLAEWNPSD